MGPTRGPPGADRTQVGPMLTPWSLLSWYCFESIPWNKCISKIMFTYVLLWIIQIMLTRKNLATKYELSLISGLSVNERKPQKCDGRTHEQDHFYAPNKTPRTHSTHSNTHNSVMQTRQLDVPEWIHIAGLDYYILNNDVCPMLKWNVAQKL